MKKNIFICFLMGFSFQIYAQMVETILVNPSVSDGMCVDNEGNVYTTCGGLSGTVLGKYELTTETFFPNFVTGLVGPTDVDFLNDSILIATNYDIDVISAYNMNTGDLSTVASGLDGPAGIAIDTAGIIYITNWGNAPEYNGHTITKILPDGTAWTYIDSEILSRPQAIAFNREHELIVHSNDNLYKIDPVDSSLHLWAELGEGMTNMVYRKKDSCIYGTSPGASILFKVNESGEASVFAGSTTGEEDGPISSARFASPLGITFSPNEDTLYVSGGGEIHSLRRILMNSFAMVNELPETPTLLYPNPLGKGKTLSIENQNKNIDYVAIYRLDGGLVYTHIVNTESQIIIPAEVLAKLSAGTFLVAINDFNKRMTYQKLVIE